ncbi:MAG: SOS response-associated peptidase [Anaerolineales bacterium]|nr:SOS response-associated peptidase [Anaerolineales bacterium]MCW5854988.1 SOS response-associated peptidase [Anaerolineales bacterium]
MPGRITLTKTAEELAATFPWLQVPPELRPRYNIAPTQPIAVVLNDGQNKVDFLSWGMIPSFTKVKMTSYLLNARAEGIERKPSFRSPFKRRRCLVLADGYYEWVKLPRKKEKIPYWVHMKDKRPFAFAGLWDSWTSMDGSEVNTCCFITCEPNDLVAQIHHRMGVILDEDDHAIWLQPDEADPKTLLPLLRPYPSEKMAYYQVGTVVSNARNDVPECIVPVDT